jgi:hypothetical protein
VSSLLAEIGPDTIPGSVAVPTWVLIFAIAALALALVWIVRWALAQLPILTQALTLSTRAVEENTELLRSLEQERKP